MADRRNGVNGGMAIKVPCRVCSTSNITLSGEQTIDGVAVVSGDRVLVTGQTSGVNNGIYDCDTGTWSRSVDWDGSYDIVTGTSVFVTSGTSNTGWYYVSTTGSITIGTTSVTIAATSTVLAVVSAYIQTLLNDSDAATARTTLGAVGLTGNETIAGNKTGSGVWDFSTYDITVKNLTVGQGNSSGTGNTTVGYGAAAAASTGTNNSAFGRSALNAHTGSNCSAFGYQALLVNTGADNSAFGSGSLDSNVGGTGNCAFGAYSLGGNTSGASNVAIGVNALSFNTTSDASVAVGNQALLTNTGANNTAIGTNAGSTATSGSNNTLIGYNSAKSSDTASNEITLGNSSIATLRCQVTSITALSDARDKTDVIDLPLGLDFINELRPVKFTWDRRDGTKKGEQEAGFIAQELDAAQKIFKAERYLNLVHKENPEKLEATPGRLLPILVKAIQELAEKNAELEERLTSAGL